MHGKKYYNSFDHFKRQHMRYSRYNRRKLIGYANEDRIKNILADFSVRHMKREVKDLPDVTFKTRLIDWDPVQRRLYNQFVKDLILELEDSFLQTTKGGALLVRSHQIISNPRQLELPCDSLKFKAIEEDLEQIGPEDHKIVIYAHYRHTIDTLTKQLAKYNPAVIYGGTKDIEYEKDKFKNTDSCRILIGNPLSCGIGTNFTISNYLIYFEYAYDLDSYDQGVSRLDRPGQTSPVTVINYALKGSIEQTKILPNLINKKAFSTDILQDPIELIKFLTLADIEDDEDLNF